MKCVIGIILVIFMLQLTDHEVDGRVSCAMPLQKLETPFECVLIRYYQLCGTMEKQKRGFIFKYITDIKDIFFRLEYNLKKQTVNANSRINGTWGKQVDGTWYNGLYNKHFCLNIVYTTVGTNVSISIGKSGGGDVLTIPYPKIVYGNFPVRVEIRKDIKIDFAGWGRQDTL